MEEKTSKFRVLVQKPDGNRPLGRPRRRMENNIECIFKKWDDRHLLDWFGLAQGQLTGC
jgi:hypothetical protein